MAYIAVVDSGSGNVRSVLAAFRRLGHDARLAAHPEGLKDALCVVVPGQSAFGDVMHSLKQRGLDEAVVASIKVGVPYIGICLGMQILFPSSDESPGVEGLGLLDGQVRHIQDIATRPELKIPHMGWNTLSSKRSLLEDQSWFYFTHSYYCAPSDASVVAANAEYGSAFCAAVQKDNMFACQFHPEKSQKSGMRLLAKLIDQAQAGVPWS